ncbi:MAG: hypothetical protein E6J87_17485 [Deltaproteobacteria bacterium]|nr:MAG: hypothetical protein E6J87_17485 [Deltaproteobacteria bacterium]
MKRSKTRSRALCAAVAGILAGTSLAIGCGATGDVAGAPNDARDGTAKHAEAVADANGCNGPNGCSGEMQE